MSDTYRLKHYDSLSEMPHTVKHYDAVPTVKIAESLITDDTSDKTFLNKYLCDDDFATEHEKKIAYMRGMVFGINNQSVSQDVKAYPAKIISMESAVEYFIDRRGKIWKALLTKSFLSHYQHVPQDLLKNENFRLFCENTFLKEQAKTPKDYPVNVFEVTKN